MAFELEAEIRKWRDHLRGTGSVGAGDLEELEGHLRDEVDELSGCGLDGEEAFLISVRRLGNVTAVGEEFAKVTGENLWRQMVLIPSSPADRRRHARELGIVVILGLLAGVLGRIPGMLGFGPFMGNSLVYLENVALFALPGVAAYLCWKRSLSWKYYIPVAAVFVVSAVLVNLYPSYDPNNTTRLIGLHLPIALWLLLGLSYAGGGWRRPGIRMDFVRFTGEAFIYAVLIGCGGVVLTAATSILFELAGMDAGDFIENYMVVFGALAIPIVAVYLVERKKTIIENIAPVLARIFTPLFLLLIISVLVAVSVSGGVRDNRDILISLDVLLVVVLGLVLYTMSARDEEGPMSLSDWLTFSLLVGALVLDALSISAMIFRLSQYGLSANKVAALGENIALLLNLIGLAVGYTLFVFRR
ncbi:MAG: permease prefix domain 1-containing protein, partial [Spirochaetia bacterium]